MGAIGSSGKFSVSASVVDMVDGGGVVTTGYLGIVSRSGNGGIVGNGEGILVSKTSVEPSGLAIMVDVVDGGGMVVAESSDMPSGPGRIDDVVSTGGKVVTVSSTSGKVGEVEDGGGLVMTASLGVQANSTEAV